jgi:hypothetical protein
MSTIVGQPRRKTSFIPEAVVGNIHPGLYVNEVPGIVGLHVLLVRFDWEALYIYASSKSLPKVKEKYKGKIMKHLGIVRNDPNPFNKYRIKGECSPLLGADEDGDDFMEIVEMPQSEIVAEPPIIAPVVVAQPAPTVEVAKPAVEPDFMEFWEAYGNKKDITRTKEVWVTLDSSEKVRVMQDIPIYLASLPNRYSQVSPYSYLSGRRWQERMA